MGFGGVASNFQRYIQQRLAEELARQGRAPAPAVPQTSDIRFYEQNVNLPAPPRAFPSPHTPNLAGITPNPADVAAVVAMVQARAAAEQEAARRAAGQRVAAGLAQGPEHDPVRQAQITRGVRGETPAYTPPPPVAAPELTPEEAQAVYAYLQQQAQQPPPAPAGTVIPAMPSAPPPVQRPPERAVPGLDLGLSPSQREQADEQAINRAKLAQQKVAQAQQTTAIDERALAKLVNGIVAQGYSREAAEAAAKEVLTGFEAGGRHITEGDVDQYLIDTTAQKAGSVQFAAEDTDSALESGVESVSGAVGDVAGALLSPLNWYTENISDPLRLGNQGQKAESLYLVVKWNGVATVEDAIESGLIPADTPPAVQQALFERGKQEYQRQMPLQLQIEKFAGMPLPGFMSGWVPGTEMTPEQAAWAQGLIAAYETGYTAFEHTGQTDAAGDPIIRVKARFEPGPRAAHEYLVGQLGWGQRLFYDVIASPDNLLLPASGAVGKGVAKGGAKAAEEAIAQKAAREAAEGAGRATVKETAQIAAGRGAQAVGQAIRIPELVLDVIPDKIVGGALNLAREGLEAVPGLGRTVRHLLEPAPRTRGDEALFQTSDDLAELDAIERERQTLEPGGGPVTAQVVPPAPEQEIGKAAAVVVEPPPQGASVQTPVGRAVRMPDGTTRTFATVAERDEFLRSIGRDDLTSAGPLPEPAPATVVDEAPVPPVIIDDAAGVVTFEGVDDIRVKRTGQGTRTRWAVQERRTGGWRNQVLEGESKPRLFKEQSEAIERARARMRARSQAVAAPAPDPNSPESVPVGDVQVIQGQQTIAIGNDDTIRVRQRGNRWMVQRNKRPGKSSPRWESIPNLDQFTTRSDAIVAAQEMVIRRRNAVADPHLPGGKSVTDLDPTPNGFRVRDRSKGRRTEIVISSGSRSGPTATIRAGGAKGGPPYTVSVNDPRSPLPVVRTVNDFDEAYFIADNELGKMTGAVRIADEPLPATAPDAAATPTGPLRESDAIQGPLTGRVRQGRREIVRPAEVVPPQFETRNGRNVDIRRAERRAVMVNMGDDFAVMPPEDLGFFDPSFVSENPGRAPSLSEQVALARGPENKAAAHAFWNDITPEFKAYRARDEQLRRETEGGQRRSGATRGSLATTQRALNDVEFAAFAHKLLQRHFGDEPFYAFRWGEDSPLPADDKKIQRWARGVFKEGENPPDLRSVVEHAMFGTDDTLNDAGKLVSKGSATRARAYLNAADGNPRVVGALGEQPSAVAGRLSDLRGDLYGERALGQSEYAKAQRARRKKLGDRLADAAPDQGRFPSVAVGERTQVDGQWTIPIGDRGTVRVRQRTNGRWMVQRRFRKRWNPIEGLGDIKTEDDAIAQAQNWVMERGDATMLHTGGVQEGIERSLRPGVSLRQGVPPEGVPEGTWTRLQSINTGDTRFQGRTTLDAADTLTDEARTDQDLYLRLRTEGHQPTPPGQAEKSPVGETVLDRRPLSEAATLRDVPNPGQKMAEIERRWARFGDIVNDDPRKLAREATALVRAIDADPDYLKDLPLALDFINMLAYRMPRHLLLADPFTSWGYTQRNIVSNTQLSLLGRGARVPDVSGTNLKTAATSYRDMKTAARMPELSVAGRMDEGLGFGQIPRELTKETGKLTDIMTHRNTPTRQLFRSLHLDWAAKPFDWKRGIDQGIERGMKLGGGYAPLLQKEVASAIEPFVGQLDRLIAAHRIAINTQDLRDAVWRLRNEYGVFSPAGVEVVIRDLATSAGASESVARSLASEANRRWRIAARQARDEAVKQTNRVFPPHKMTNLDRYASYLTLFHMWPTRAAKFVLSEMVRNPALAAHWQRAHEGLDRMLEENPDMPPTVRGMIELGRSPFGFALFANPSALFLVTALTPERTDYPDPDGMTWLGRQVQTFREKTGLGPVPFIDAILNVTGVYGDTWTSDIFPSRTLDLAGAAIDYMGVKTGHGPGSPWYQRAFLRLREAASGIVPGTEKITATDPTALTEDNIAHMVLEQNPDLRARVLSDDPHVRAEARVEWAQILENPQDPRLIAAEQAVYGARFVTRIINAVAPLTVRARNLGRDEIVEDARQARERRRSGAPPAGQEDAQAVWNAIAIPGNEDQIPWWFVNEQQIVPFGEQTITRAELEAMTPDERRVLADKVVARWYGPQAVGQGEMTPRESAMIEARSTALAGAPVLTALDQQYRALGTERQQRLHDLHTAITHGGRDDEIPTRETIGGLVVLDVPQATMNVDPSSGLVDGTITLDQLNAMSVDERRDVANRVVGLYGGASEFAAYQEERRAFREANPRFAEYNDWRSVVYDWPGGPFEFARQLRRISPNFDAYLRDRESRGALTEGSIASVEGYLAQMGEPWHVYGPEAKPSVDYDKLSATDFLIGVGSDSGGGSGGVFEQESARESDEDRVVIRDSDFGNDAPGEGGEVGERRRDRERLIENITEDLAEAEVFEQLLAEQVTAMTEGIPYDRLEPMSRAYVDAKLREMGIEPPSMSEEARLYLQWKAQQPPGADTSIAAFVAYLESFRDGD